METKLAPLILLLVLPFGLFGIIDSAEASDGGSSTPTPTTSSLLSSPASTSPSSSASSSSGSGSLNFSAFFVFGDSLVDVGNNNYVTTVARANLLPFGIDYPAGPTGRFCNGKVVVDFGAESLSLPSPPPYLAPTTRGNVLLQGVSYASAAAGIIRSTGYTFVGRVDTDTQIEWFTNNVKELQELIGASATQTLLNKALFSITVGANDYVNNYLLRVSPTGPDYTPEQYQKILLDKFSTQLQQIYNIGARIVLVTSIGAIGCIPSQLARRSKNGECSEYVNGLAANFNQGLATLLNALNANLPGAKFIYADGYNPIIAFRNNPQQYGLKFGAQACCGGGRFKGQVLCLPVVVPCPDRRDYLFWDAFHPTEAVNKILAQLFRQTLATGLAS